jgi:hypothetical protein
MPGLTERTHIIVHKGEINEAGSGTWQPFQPENLPEWHLYCKAVTYVLAIEEVKGAPTESELTAKFEVRQPDAPGTTAYNYQAERWIELQKQQAEKAILEGVGWYGSAHPEPAGGAAGIVWKNGDTAPVVIRRTINTALGASRLFLKAKFAGGTSPAIVYSLTCTPQV